MDMDLAGDSPAPQVGSGREKIPVVVDVCLRPTSTARREHVRGAILTYIEDVGSLRYSAEPWSSRARTRIRTSTRTSRARASPTSVSTPSTVSDDPVAPALSLDPSLSRRISRWAPSAPKHSCA